MCDQLESCSSLQESTASNSQTSSIHSIKRKCYKFFSCFKNARRRKLKGNVTNSDSDDYDYIVEKLVIKRVPFIFSEIPSNSSEVRNDNFMDIRRPLMRMGASETHSLLYCSEGLNQNTIPVDIVDKSTKFHSNTATSNERNNKFTLSAAYDGRIIELMNTLTSLHPDLKERERPVKDPLNAATNKSIEEVPAINNGGETMEVPGIVSTRKEFGDAKSRNKQKIYYSKQDADFNQFQDSFKEQLVQCDEGRFRSVKNVTELIDTDELNRGNSNEKFKRVKSSRAMMKTLDKSIINNDTLNTKLRWKITVKNFKFKQSNSYNNYQEANKYFSAN